MKEMNGTVTLAYVEEDNKQRVIFRVFPLCTREGCMLLGSKELFPDDGSLRVVPDKREQSTFKERMREIGGLCAINLVSDGRELIKVRQNRNYAPEQGERNQQAIYSDVICEFSPDACFEVVQAGADASAALTAQVLIQNGMLLVGPVDREAAKDASLNELKPFGNDSFLLHQFRCEILGERRIYWNPEALMNWRQRRNALRRKDRGHIDEAKKAAETDTAPEAAEMPVVPENTVAEATPEAIKAEQPAEMPKTKPERPAKKERKPETAARQPEAEKLVPAETTVAEGEDVSLPIGARLEILDQDLSFDQQISRLAQPLSSGANRLSTEEMPAQEEEDEPVSTAYFNGTPLNRNARQITRSMRKPQAVAHVVERHMLQSGAFQDENSAYQLVENPIERLLMDFEYVWQNSSLRRRAMSELLENESFMQDMLDAFRNRGISTNATIAAQEQLADIEAERLDLLMQLDAAKENEKEYREKVLASLSAKLRGESDRLRREVSKLEKTRDALQAASQTLSQSVADKTREYMVNHVTCISGTKDSTVVLSPVVGKHYDVSELSENLRQHMNSNGFAISDDEAVGLLTLFAVSDSLCISAETQTDARCFAELMVESFGLQSVSATTNALGSVELISLLPENGLRTPTVTIQPFGTDSMTVYGHKTIYLATPYTQTPSFMPVFHAPKHSRSAYNHNDEWESVQPASIDTFRKIKNDVHPLLSEAEKWFGNLKNALKEQQLAVPEVTLEDMRCFMEIGTRRVRGGFVAAADIAVCCWIAPMIRFKDSGESLRSLLSGLPRTLELLNIQ
ncbi:MAG: hypothetical protein IKK08_04005 [Clostridia bacterium]|nr:hypothetical protein [Clostridia bacterium]